MTLLSPVGRSYPTAALWGAAVVCIGVASAFVGRAEKAEAKRAPEPQVVQPKPTAHPENLKPTVPGSLIRHGISEAPPKAPGAIRIATYNVENFFDSTGPANPDEPSSSPTSPKPEAHKKAVAAAIRAVDADIIALEEVESKEVITRFRNEYLKGMGYDFIASIDSGDPRGIEQSVLSRFPLSNETVWLHMDLGGPHTAKLGGKSNPEAGKPMVFKRSPLGVSVAVPPAADAAGKPIELGLFALHHKSGPYHGYLREAEAKAVVNLAGAWQRQHPGSNVVILGDFNARPSEASFKVYLDAGFSDPFGEVVMARADDAAGKHPSPKEDPRFITHASGRALDHILLAPAMAKTFEIKNRFVLGTPQRPADVDWRMVEPPAGYASDHYPVVVDLAPPAR